MAPLGKGHAAGFVATGTAVGVGEGSEAQGQGWGAPVWQQRSWATPQDQPLCPFNTVLRQEASLGPSLLPCTRVPRTRGHQSLCDGAMEGVR